MSRTAQADEQLITDNSVLTPAMPGSRGHLSWTGLGGDSLPLTIARAARQYNGLIIAVTPDMQAAELLQEQVTFFLGQQALPVTIFPDWETLPYDNFSASDHTVHTA